MKITFLIFISIISFIENAEAKVWNVGPTRQYKFCSEVSELIADNDTIDIDFATYENDKQVTWSKNNLLIRGIGGRPNLRSGSLIENNVSNGKGIFVIKGNNATIENIEFSNAKVPDHNGAGIRDEGAGMSVRYCTFTQNQMGILQGGTIPNSTILIEFCRFINNGAVTNPGYQHNIYINHIDTLIFRFNLTQDAIAEGHELKSRAANNFILYNRISNLTSTDSRNIDLPNGGTAVILGNIIEQGPNTSNSNIIGFGLEGLNNPGPHNLFICNNIIVNRMNKGNFINVAEIDTLSIFNNLFLGAMTGGFLVGKPIEIDSSNNFINTDLKSAQFVNLQGYDYHLSKASPAVNSGLDLKKIIKGYSLTPEFEFVSDTNFAVRTKDKVIDIGAYEYSDGTSLEADHFVERGIKIYPNPANDKIRILIDNDSNTESSAKIFNFFGQFVKEVKLNEAGEIDITSLQAGPYFLQIGCKTAEFVKNKD